MHGSGVPDSAQADDKNGFFPNGGESLRDSRPLICSLPPATGVVPDDSIPIPVRHKARERHDGRCPAPATTLTRNTRDQSAMKANACGQTIIFSFANLFSAFILIFIDIIFGWKRKNMAEFYFCMYNFNF